MGPSKVLETRSEAEVVWLKAKPGCGLKVLGSSLSAEISYPSSAVSSNSDWLSEISFKFNEAGDGVIAAVVKRGKEYFPFFISIESLAGQPKAVLDKVWASPVSRFGAIDVFNDGFCALRVKNEAGETFSTYPASAECVHVSDGDLLCRYLQGLADDGDLRSGIEMRPAGLPAERRLILTLPAGQKAAEDIKSQEPQTEERKTLKARLAEQEERIIELNTEAERLEKQAVEREAAITSLTAEIENWQAASVKNREEIERMQAELEMLRATLTNREADLVDREKKVAELRTILEILNQGLKEREELVAKMAKEKSEWGQEAVKHVDQLGEIARNWERAAEALRKVIEASLFFKYLPSVRRALEKFPLEREI